MFKINIMKKVLFICFYTLIFIVNINCNPHSEFKRNGTPNFYKLDSVYTIDSIKYTKQIYKIGDSIISINIYSFNQLISIQIRDKRLFEIYRDSMELQSNRIIGSQLYGFSCMGCHDARNEKILNYSDSTNFIPFVRTHLETLKMDTLNQDEIVFIKDYLWYFKKK